MIESGFNQFNSLLCLKVKNYFILKNKYRKYTENSIIKAYIV